MRSNNRFEANKRLPMPRLSILSSAFALFIPLAWATGALACLPPPPGQITPTDSQYTNLYMNSADSIVLARAIEQSDNGKANATVPTGEGQAVLRIQHTFKGLPPARVEFTVGGCGYGLSWNKHIPMDHDIVLFLKGNRVLYGLELPADQEPLKATKDILDTAASTPFP
jgi:hypothetical protein